MCNLSQKEGSSLFAALTKRQRKILPKNLHFHAEKLFISFWSVDMQFRKQPRGLNEKRGNRKNEVLEEKAAAVTCDPPPPRPGAQRHV